MKRIDIIAVIYVILLSVGIFIMTYLMWTGAHCIIIDSEATKANALDMVMIVLVSLYTTRDVFFSCYRPGKFRRKERTNHDY